ncbi:MAG: hypothetical protein MJ252_16335 [archaeon]|nr:hypothetical protein [archaeon]
MAEIILIIFKNEFLHYNDATLANDCITIIIYFALNYAFLFFASRGNKAEIAMYMIYALILSIPIPFIYLYYGFFQLYPLHFDFGFCVIGFFLWVGCFIFIIIAFLSFKIHQREI